MILVCLEAVNILRSLGGRRESDVRSDVGMRVRLIVRFLDGCGDCSFGK